MKQRVAITGIGAITPIGTGVDELWAGVRSGRSAIRAIDRFDPTHTTSKVAGHVEFEPLDYMAPKRARRLDRFSQFALISAQMALDDAGLSAHEAGCASAGIYVGSALGGVAFAEEQHEGYIRNGPHGVNPLLALSVFGGAASSNVTIELGLTGPSLAYGNSCAAGLIAIGEAARLIEDGRVPVMLAGGAEAPLSPLVVGAFAMIRVLSTRNGDPETASRPFDCGRDGFVIAEGATVLVLESLDHARARGARIYAEIAGYGTTSDAYHMTAPHPDGTHAARAMCAAHAQRRALPRRDRLRQCARILDGTQRPDRVPRDPDRARSPRRAGGGQWHQGAARPCPRRDRRDRDCDLRAGTAARPPARHRQPDRPGSGLRPRHHPAGGRDQQVEHLLCNAFGFGGVNATLAMRAAQPELQREPRVTPELATDLRTRRSAN